MARRFVATAGPDKGRIYTLNLGEPVLLGRGRHVQLQVNDPKISRVHCELTLRNDRVVIIDQGSSSGMHVNGKPVTQATLAAGDIVKVGDTQLRFEGDDPADKTTVPPDEVVPAKSGIPALPPSRMKELSGTTLAHFLIGPVLARGNTGWVFRAHDFKKNFIVALKILNAEFARGDEDVQRFIRAMKTALPLRHANIVTIHNAGRTGPYCWISMEYVEGESLANVIRNLGTAGMLDWRHAFRVALHIGRALEYAHGHQIIHRNLTPQNILVTDKDKTAKLGDLALAKAQEGNLALQITKPDEIIGDPRYMPPERTVDAGVVDERSDIYSLGALVYHLTTGRPPFEGDTLLDTLVSIRKGTIAKPKQFQLALPDLFEGVIMRMLARRPDERYQSVTKLLVDLERIAKFQGLTL